MSRRKITRRNQKSQRKNGRHLFSSTFVTLDQDTREPVLRRVSLEADGREIAAMPDYERAHHLMPPPRSPFMDPEEYREELVPSVQVLERVEAGETVDSDAILKALGILGHSPNETACRALLVFSRSDHSLAPVGKLALAECSSLYGCYHGSSPIL